MSAIFGIVKNRGSVEQEDIIRMKLSLAHRAVDGCGDWQTDNVFLGHNKLIVTLEQREEQMPLKADGLVISADITLHNRGYLFSLLGVDERWERLYPDSLLLLEAYKKWGEDCLVHLEGEYSFVIWDELKKRLFCAVDHIGFRPLFYYNSPDIFVFASEIKGVLSVKKTPNVFNEKVLIEYFFGHSDQTATYNNEVFALCGGNKIIVEDGNIKITKYWTPQKTGKYSFKKDSEWAECLKELLFQAVENRMRTELPVGISLSGGIDSSSIACIAGKILKKRNQPLYAFSSVLPLDHKGVETDERNYIGMVGRHVKNLQQIYVEAKGVGPFSDLKEGFGYNEMIPNVFFYMDKAINEAAAQKNIRSFFMGYGGDFFVSHNGNSSVYQLMKQGQLFSVIKLLRHFHINEKRSYSGIVKRELLAKTKLFDYLLNIKYKNRINWLTYTPLTDNFVAKHRAGFNLDLVLDQTEYMIQYIADGHMGRTMGMFANRHEAFQLSMATPLFDKRINDFMIEVPPEQFILNGVKRSLLRRAMEGVLPPEIQWRTNKRAYSPDYINRIKNSKQFVNEVLSEGGNDIIGKYIDRKRILDNFDDLAPKAHGTKQFEISGIRIAQAVISSVIVKLLADNGYIFVD